MTVLLNRWILWTLGLDEHFDGMPFASRVNAFDRVLGEAPPGSSTAPRPLIR
ncbi:hypothetical protein ACN20G_26445 (plasmid) [Streptomyces sp. BI20]|uniref:hypothetical protein n=1 Tax=Streptomyces sp. BI20 TaxID=3403460 RepID=UPI003C796E28